MYEDHEDYKVSTDRLLCVAESTTRAVIGCTKPVKNSRTL
jgi:hypothetical protein